MLEHQKIAGIYADAQAFEAAVHLQAFLFERFPKRIRGFFCTGLSVHGMCFHILHLLLAVCVVNRRDLHKALDQRSDDVCILSVRADHIAAYQDRVGRCVGGLIRDLTVSALKYIVVKVREHDKTERLLSLLLISTFFRRFLRVEVMHFRIAVGTGDHPDQKCQYE